MLKPTQRHAFQKHYTFIFMWTKCRKIRQRKEGHCTWKSHRNIQSQHRKHGHYRAIGKDPSKNQPFLLVLVCLNSVLWNSFSQGVEKMAIITLHSLLHKRLILGRLVQNALNIKISTKFS